MLEMSLPSKLTSYFAAGRPVLGAVPEKGWTAAVLDASSAAVRVPAEAPGQLLDAALELAGDHERRALLGKAATEYCHLRYGSTAGLGRYAGLVRELLDRGPRAARP
jgi:hypothetical protein